MKHLRALVREDASPTTLETSEALDRLLSEATAEAHSAGLLNIIFLYGPNDDHISLVVGGDETVVGFNYGHGDPPYYASKGAGDSDDPVLTAYVSLKHHTEFPRRWVVPAEAGRRAAVEFLTTGARPTSLEWVEL
jgi:hypothetical protein